MLQVGGQPPRGPQAGGGAWCCRYCGGGPIWTVISRSSSWQVLDSRVLVRQLQYTWTVSMVVASTEWGVLKMWTITTVSRPCMPPTLVDLLRGPRPKIGVWGLFLKFSEIVYLGRGSRYWLARQARIAFKVYKGLVVT